MRDHAEEAALGAGEGVLEGAALPGLAEPRAHRGEDRRQQGIERAGRAAEELEHPDDLAAGHEREGAGGAEPVARGPEGAMKAGRGGEIGIQRSAAVDQASPGAPRRRGTTCAG